MDEEDFIILKIWKRPMKKFRRTGESQEDIDHFINRQKSANTNKKTATDMKTLLHYMEANGMTNDRIESLLASKLRWKPFECKWSEVCFNRKQTNMADCLIINYLLTYLARAVLWNIGTWSFFYGPR